jgi:hypothetical protein
VVRPLPGDPRSSDLNALRGPTAGRIQLPIDLDASARATYDLSNPRRRDRMYAIVIIEGGSNDDFAAWLDRDALIEAWPARPSSTGPRRVGGATSRPRCRERTAGRMGEFARLIIRHGEEAMELDLARDWRRWPPVNLQIGPVLHIDDAVSSKVAALVGRQAPRDFIDIAAALDHGYRRADLMRLAFNRDPGLRVEDFIRAARRLDHQGRGKRRRASAPERLRSRPAVRCRIATAQTRVPVDWESIGSLLRPPRRTEALSLDKSPCFRGLGGRMPARRSRRTARILFRSRSPQGGGGSSLPLAPCLMSRDTGHRCLGTSSRGRRRPATTPTAPDHQIVSGPGWRCLRRRPSFVTKRQPYSMAVE